MENRIHYSAVCTRLNHLPLYSYPLPDELEVRVKYEVTLEWMGRGGTMLVGRISVTYVRGAVVRVSVGRRPLLQLCWPRPRRRGAVCLAGPGCDCVASA